MSKPVRIALLSVVGAAIGIAVMALLGMELGTSWWTILLAAAVGGYVGGLIHARRK
ncbi:hypothetical protein [Litorisediminicola beolgyonensis]|uniref:Uncharacterized protein n=1 Tax=Litorisediminicola beolgyonensis TaxID=1173614 RepID=A0ABW3ZMZ2_9RHOB